MTKDRQPLFVQVYEGNMWQAGLLQSMLRDAGMEAVLKDEIMGNTNPWWAAPGGAGAVKVLVLSEDGAAAAAIVKDFEQTQSHD